MKILILFIALLVAPAAWADRDDRRAEAAQEDAAVALVQYCLAVGNAAVVIHGAFQGGVTRDTMLKQLRASGGPPLNYEYMSELIQYLYDHPTQPESKTLNAKIVKKCIEDSERIVNGMGSQ